MKLSHVLKRKRCARPQLVVTAISMLAEMGDPLECQSIKIEGAWATDNPMEQSGQHSSGGDKDRLLT